MTWGLKYMKSRIQYEIDVKRKHWTQQRMKCVDIHREISDIPLWKSPIMSIEVIKEKDEKTTK